MKIDSVLKCAALPLCRLGKACIYGAGCMFRHRATPNPIPTRTLLDDTPEAITNLIFEFKVEMERIELSGQFTREYQRQLELLMLRELRDIRGNIRREIDSKYGDRCTLDVNEYPLKFLTKARIDISRAGSKNSVSWRDRDEGMDPNMLNMMAMEVHNTIACCELVVPEVGSSLYTGGERITIEVSKMPYRFENGNMIADGILLLDGKLCDKPCFTPIAARVAKRRAIIRRNYPL